MAKLLRGTQHVGALGKFEARRQAPRLPHSKWNGSVDSEMNDSSRNKIQDDKNDSGIH